MASIVALRLAADLATIVSQAEKHGTLPRLKSVAIYFDEMELRTIIKSLREGLPEAGTQEPVAWAERINGKIVSVRMDRSVHCNEPLYAERKP